MRFKLVPKIAAAIGIKNPFRVTGHLKSYVRQHWHVECRDQQGNLKWVVDDDNLVTNEGDDTYLDSTLVTGVTSPKWYIFLVDDAGFITYDVTDMASLITTGAPNPPYTNGWTELIAYTQVARVQWIPGPIASQAVDNSLSPGFFTMNDTKTIRGAGLINDNTIGGTLGKILGELDFVAPQGVAPGDVISVVIICSMSCP